MNCDVDFPLPSSIWIWRAVALHAAVQRQDLPSADPFMAAVAASVVIDARVFAGFFELLNQDGAAGGAP
jgi:hypothetical protein